MKAPINRLEIIRRLESEIARRLDARETVLGRIERSGLTGLAALAVTRKAARMMKRVEMLQTELYEVARNG